jgi:hypothetical protein
VGEDSEEKSANEIVDFSTTLGIVITLEIAQEPFDMVGKTSLAFRVVAIPILLAFIAILETRHSFATFRLVTFVLLFFLLADVASWAWQVA